MGLTKNYPLYSPCHELRSVFRLGQLQCRRGSSQRARDRRYARGSIVVLKIISPDRAVAAQPGHFVAAETGAIFADHHCVLAHVDIVWIDRDVVPSSEDQIRVIKNCKGAWASGVVIVHIEPVI